MSHDEAFFVEVVSALGKTTYAEAAFEELLAQAIFTCAETTGAEMRGRQQTMHKEIIECELSSGGDLEITDHEAELKRTFKAFRIHISENISFR